MATKLWALLNRTLQERNWLSSAVQLDWLNQRHVIEGRRERKRTFRLIQKLRPPVGFSIVDKLARDAYSETAAAGMLPVFSPLIDDFVSAHREWVQASFEAAERNESHCSDANLFDRWCKSFWKLDERRGALAADIQLQCGIRSDAQEPPAIAADQIGPMEKALALLISNPELDNGAVARKVGVKRQTLYKPNWKQYQDARRLMKAPSIPKGSKSADGTIEAIDDE